MAIFTAFRYTNWAAVREAIYRFGRDAGREVASLLLKDANLRDRAGARVIPLNGETGRIGPKTTKRAGR